MSFACPITHPFASAAVCDDNDSCPQRYECKVSMSFACPITQRRASAAVRDHLHPAPCTLHPAPCTLHPAPQTVLECKVSVSFACPESCNDPRQLRVATAPAAGRDERSSICTSLAHPVTQRLASSTVFTLCFTSVASHDATSIPRFKTGIGLIWQVHLLTLVMLMSIMSVPWLVGERRGASIG